MKHTGLVPVLVTIAALSVGSVTKQEAAQIDSAKLKEMVMNMGYEVKELNSEPGKEKYEFTVTTGGLDIPIAAEISPSRNYVWLTVFLGSPPSAASEKNAELLKRNFKIQPCQFYVTEKGNLMMGIALDNRGITPTVLLRNKEKIAKDVVDTQDAWGS